MSSPSCLETRSYLATLRTTGTHPPPAPEVWEALVRHGAVAGTAAYPSLTPVGEHVLAELELRAYRTDPLPLERVATEIGRILEEFDAVAQSAEYFLTELGPVVPPAAVPLLRPVAVGLANRRETPAELAEEFRNIWGGMEVMGGEPKDRLLAAELINATTGNMGDLYSPILSNTERIRATVGLSRPSVTPATILQIASGKGTPVPLDGYLAVRESAGSEEAAALLAAAGPDAAAAVARRDALGAALTAPGPLTPDARHAATLLLADEADAATGERVRALAGRLAGKVSSPLTAAALLAEHADLSPEEIADWLTKAIAVLSARQLAPSPAEIAALAVAIVHGLPASEFHQPSPAGTRPSAAPVTVAALTALHAWLYRPLLGSPNAVAPAAA